MEDKNTCNRENGSRSDLWGRECWIADSLVSLVQSRLEYLSAMHAPDINDADMNPEHPLWVLVKDLNYYCEELRVKNGLRDPAVLNRDEKWLEEVELGG